MIDLPGPLIRRIAMAWLVPLLVRASMVTVLAASAPAATTTLPMHRDGAHASIDVVINGRPARMLLDTGADQIVLTRAAAQRLGLSIRETATPGAGAAGTYTASTTMIADLSAGGVHRRKLTAYVVPVPQEFLYDGVLGTPFFAALLTTLDYQQGEVTFQANRSREASPGFPRIPIKRESGKLLAQASAAGVTGWFVVDTGAGNALTLFAPTVSQHGLRGKFSPAVRSITGASPGGYTRGTLVRLPEVTIGPHTLQWVVAELSEADQGLFSSTRYVGALGGELWRRFQVTLDYAGGYMTLRPNDAFSQPFAGPRSGLVPSLVDGQIRIIDIVADSPAADAGLRVGETVIAVNGESTESQQGAEAREFLDRVVQALRAAAGTQVQLRVRDASGMERELVLRLRDLL